MTSFKITNDDLAVRGLQEGNKTPVISGPVLPVKASNPVQKSPENIPLQSGIIERRSHDPHHPLHRRHDDRRKTESPVLLDTRSSHERRTKIENADDTDNTMHGIDEIV